jgi:hypothetical protein
MGAAQAEAARMKKINPKGRKLDKNGNPIVTKDAARKSRHDEPARLTSTTERGLTPRDGKAPRAN